MAIELALFGILDVDICGLVRAGLVEVLPALYAFEEDMLEVVSVSVGVRGWLSRMALSLHPRMCALLVLVLWCC